ncbi:MAG: hypothetical protein B6242_05985 [Anaerolineaceae bacterium 4572_78]|nr:MAG: hypothetical protein B6242_05985 [Anaerolineaceae bacterium 4572_78]
MVIDGVNILLETERTSVFLIDDANNELVLRYSNEGDADIRLPAPWQGIAGWVARHDQPALVNDTLKDIRHLRQVARETGYETHSILCVPLKVEGRVIGVVQVLNKTEGRQFTHHHQSMLLDFTKWASIALHNAQLYHERVQAYQKLAAEQDRRLTAERRGNMAAIILDMAHTMNNVLGAIRVWASNLERMMNKKPHCPIITFDHQIQHIRKNSEEAIKLIGNITSPIEYVEVAPVDVHVALTYAVDNSWWPDNITYQKDYGVDVPLVMADTKRLETTFHNLLSNAIQAMTKHGGRVVLQTRRADDEWVQITISDTGPGISHELQKHIFDPGVSGRDGGLGVGLWLVETFIHQFGGHIILEDSTKDGTTFVLTLLSARAV